MGFFDIFKFNKTVDSEIEQREHLQTGGRIADGIIIDNETSEAGEEIVYYNYTIQGVDFESSEILTEEQRESPSKYSPGAKVGVRFDPKNHGNSRLV